MGKHVFKNDSAKSGRFHLVLPIVIYGLILDEMLRDVSQLARFTTSVGHPSHAACSAREDAGCYSDGAYLRDFEIAWSA